MDVLLTDGLTTLNDGCEPLYILSVYSFPFFP